MKSEEFLETAHVHGNIYGTSFAAVNTVKQQGKICILDIDVQGVESVKKSGKLNAAYFFLAPPSLEALEARLRGRGTETEEKVQLRLQNAIKELEYSERPDFWDAVVVNDNLADCCSRFEGLVREYFPQL